MPLKELRFRPGINREGTSLANEGGWFDGNHIRFRSGNAEKIGGWTKDVGGAYQNTAGTILQPPYGSFWGVCRSLWNWVTLAGYNLLGVGTNLKFYIQNGVGGNFYDVTPLRYTTIPGTATFSATPGSPVITVTDTAHNAQAGDFVTYSGAVSLGGNITAAVLNREYRVATYIDANTYTIVATVSANGSDIGNGGSSTVAAYQITTGSDIYTVGVGWGAGGWSGVTTGYPSTGWGASSSAGLGIGIQLRLWSQQNYGENLIINPRGGALYYWVNSNTPGVYNRAQILSSTNTNTQVTTGGGSAAWWQTDATCPSICNFVLVSDASRFVLVFGCNDPTGTYATTALDPMQIRWSDQENLLVWAPNLATNQAGGIRLSHGSEIITAFQSRQEILVWTDASVYSLQYLGPPYIWGSQLLADNISIVSPNAVVSANNVVYWMGVDKFYMYTGRVETLPSAVRTYVFENINLAQSYQFFAGTNEGYSEVWWFYCSRNSDVIDRYVIYNHLDRVWYYGSMQRTAWNDSPLRDFPMATTGGNAVVYHEDGTDDGTTNPPSPISAYVQSSDFDIGEGHNFGFVWRLIPDITFDGSTVNQPSAYITMLPRANPGANYTATDTNPAVISTQNYVNQPTYTIQQFTQILYVRARGRQLALKVSSDTPGTQWQVGVNRLDVRPDGRR